MKNRPPLLPILVFFILVIPLAATAYQGTFSRFHADDFCMAADASQLGLGNMLIKWYSTWTGRYSFILGTGLLGPGGPELASILPTFIIIAWLLLLAWAVLPLLQKLKLRHSAWLSACASALTLLILFSTTPNLFQSLLWEDGLVNYTLPLVGLTGLAGILLRAWLGQMKPGLAAAVGFGLAFVSGGFTESFTALQTTLLILLLFSLFWPASRETRWRMMPIIFAALSGAVLALVVVVVAPGNQVRMVAVGDRPGMVRILSFSLRNAAFIAGKYILQHPGWSLLSLLAPFLAGWLLPYSETVDRQPFSLKLWWAKPWFRGWIILPLAVFTLLAAACAPVVFALNAYPDDRTIFVPQFILVFAVMVWVTLLAFGLKQAGWLPNLSSQPTLRRGLMVVVLAAMIIATGASAWHTISLIPVEQTYAQRWDGRAALLAAARKAGQAEVSIAGLENRFGVPDLRAEPDYWVNHCMANYYGFSAIHGR